MTRQRTQAIDARHSELNHQANKALAWLLVGLIIFGIFAPRMWYDGRWYHELLTAVGAFGILFGGFVGILTARQSHNLAKHEEELKQQQDQAGDEPERVEATARPSTLRIVYVRDNQTQIRELDLDMDGEELSEFVRAIHSNKGAMTKRMLKKRTNILNVDGRYGAWLDAMKDAGAVEQVGVTWTITKEGANILDELLPH